MITVRKEYSFFVKSIPFFVQVSRVVCRARTYGTHARVQRSLIHAGAAGHSVGRDIPGMTHGAHLRLVGDETSLFINVGRRGTRRCVSSLLRLREDARKRDRRQPGRCRIDRDFLALFKVLKIAFRDRVVNLRGELISEASRTALSVDQR